METNNNGSYEWDAEIQKDDQFPDVPDGDYDFVVDHFERAEFDGSEKIPPCHKAVVYFNILLPGGEQSQIKENYILHAKMEWKLSELFTGLGMKKKGEPMRMDWNAIAGKRGRCKVEKQPDRRDPDKEYTHIKKIYPKATGYTKGVF